MKSSRRPPRGINKNISNLQKNGKSIIFVCGALYAENLMNKFKENGMSGRILYYFPHSNKNYTDSILDFRQNFGISRSWLLSAMRAISFCK